MKYFFSLLLICALHITFAQKAQNVYFLTDAGDEVSTLDSADYTRVIRAPDSGMVNFELLEFYKNKNIRKVGYISSFEPTTILEGYVREFYPNGNKKEISTYIKNVKTGESTLYFENGAIQEKRIYSISADKPLVFITENTDFFNDDYLVKYLGDSLGHALLDSNGTGTFKYISGEGDIISGTYLNGRKNGIWTSISKKDGATTEETYVNSVFTKGVRRETGGLASEYTSQQVQPEYIGGMAGFGKYIMQNFHYSAAARKNGVAGKVILSFIVEKDGSVSHFVILQDIGFGAGAEAARVVATSPKWIPGRLRGKPVRTAYILPIALKLEVE